MQKKNKSKSLSSTNLFKKKKHTARFVTLLNIWNIYVQVINRSGISIIFVTTILKNHGFIFVFKTCCCFLYYTLGINFNKSLPSASTVLYWLFLAECLHLSNLINFWRTNVELIIIFSSFKTPIWHYSNKQALNRNNCSLLKQPIYLKISLKKREKNYKNSLLNTALYDKDIYKHI